MRLRGWPASSDSPNSDITPNSKGGRLAALYFDKQVQARWASSHPCFLR